MTYRGLPADYDAWKTRSDRDDGPDDEFEPEEDDMEDEETERMREALQRIVQWSEAYPLDIFPEPNFKKAREVLTAAGMTLDAISASCMRHVVESVGNIAREALEINPKTRNPT